MKAYDHNRKAGNEGDIVKHIALIAALNSLSEKMNAKPFIYTDLFAGYATNPLQSNGEWRSGIAQLPCRAKVNNDDVGLFYDWYLSRPSLLGASYPGSSLIARDVLLHNRQQIQLNLYDISAKAIDSLRAVYKAGEYEGERHYIFHRATNYEDDAVVSANFLFIDPPGLASSKRPSYPELATLMAFADQLNTGHVMIWLPIMEAAGAQPLAEQEAELRQHGYQLSKVQWAEQAKMKGCMLAYKLPEASVMRVQKAINELLRLTRWQLQKGEAVQHLAPVN